MTSAQCPEDRELRWPQDL